jgi:hypothetical protein
MIRENGWLRKDNSMNNSGISIKTGALFVIFLFIITSCATTKLKNVWRDNSYSGKIKRVLVIGVIKKPHLKRFFEYEMVQQLEIRGIDAIAGYSVLPPDKEADKDIIVSKLKELDLDGVLITRLVDRKEVSYVDSSYVPPANYSGWHSYYSGSYREVYSYTVKQEIVSVETNLYDAGSEQLVWSSLSETFVYGDISELIRSFVQVMIKDLFKKNLFE